MFEKSEITQIPFEKLGRALEARIEEAREAREESRNAAKEAKIAKMKAECEDPYQSAEGGSDGYEESLLETPEVAKIDRFPKVAMDEATASFIEHFDLGPKYTWMLPQASAFLAGFKVQRDADTEKVSAELTWVHILENSSNSSFFVDQKTRTRVKGLRIKSEEDYRYWCEGLRAYLRAPRGLILKPPKSTKQVKSPNACAIPRWNHLVPLMLAAFKESDQHIQYSDWSRANEDTCYSRNSPDVAIFLDHQLERAMLFTPERAEYRSPEEMRIAQKAMLVRSEKPTPADTTYSLAFKNCKIFANDVNILAIHMLIQTWCAHPCNRGPYQVLNPFEWDNVPDVLITSAIMSGGPKIKKVATALDWSA
jgi:hypothetical protein